MSPRHIGLTLPYFELESLVAVTGGKDAVYVGFDLEQA
jgi:hypothetical protein